MNRKIVIYQVLVRLFGNDNDTCRPGGSLRENGCGKMNDFTSEALSAIRDLGVTHIWFTGVLEHATQTDYSNFGISRDHPALVKGKGGSPYAVKDYYDIDPDIADDVPERMQEFEELVKRTHAAGLQAIIDFVPNHVARQYRSDRRPPRTYDFGAFDDNRTFFRNQNNFYYLDRPLSGSVDWQQGATQRYSEVPAKATGNDRFDAYPSPADWYETVKLNYGIDYATGEKKFLPIPNTWVKMLKILKYWAAKGIDGFRCDMAEMVPVEFWNWAIGQVKNSYPDILFIAEVYQPPLYREYLDKGLFDILYDKEGMYNTLRNVIRGEAPAKAITACWQQEQDIQNRMLYFIENHDEQRVASDFFAGSAVKGRPAMVLCACMSNNPVMLYFGQELGERGMDEEGFSGTDGRTTLFDYWSLSSVRRWRNGDKYDGGRLTAAEKEIREFYRTLFNICLQERAISDGEFFDLTYANPTSSLFDDRLQFAFLRKWENELILIVVHFGDALRRVSVRIPDLAFKTLNIPQKRVKAENLFTRHTETFPLTSVLPVTIPVEAHGAVLLKINL